MRQPAVQPVPPELAVCSVTKHFETRRGRLKVLDRVSLSVQKGRVPLPARSLGCGKSTLFNIIAGLEEPDSGEVLVRGTLSPGPGPDRVVVFQDGALFPWRTALGNVEFGLSLQNIPRAERRGACAGCAGHGAAGLASGDAYIHELSGGMRQRVAIAPALALEPKLLLMDEPFAALDAQTRNMMHEELQRIWAWTGQTIIFVTHNVSEAIRLGDRIAVLSFRPGRVRREVTLQHPRPRKADDPRSPLEIRTFLVRDLRSDVEAAMEEELRDG